MDYSKLSDFEINCEVLEVFSPDIKHMCLSVDSTCFYDCGPTGDGWNQIDIPDYCNNPADAWPIIVGKRISIMFDGTDPQYEGEYHEWIDAISPDQKHGIQHQSNPLRAAMIVFLMMQEAKAES
ncbi:DUF2591 domain-containing protein [Yokenella regensburgei]|uniref:phage protein NinX family protein n=1 Tax=Yokenella regensburgei TaxID=158877 RepID=UPI003F136EF9